MKLYNKLILLIAIGITTNAIAQSPVSGFINKKGKGSVALSFNSESYDEVYLVPEKTKGVPVYNKVTTTSVNLYTTYGITDKIEVVFSLPYISSKGEGEENFLAANGFSNTRSGLQDASVFLKFKPYSTKIGNIKIDFLGTAGITTPLGDYKVDEGLQSIIAIGNRSTKITTMGIVHAQGKEGVFFTGQVGYSIRDNRVPNAFVSEAKIGYAGKKVYVDGWVAYQNSDPKGTDILQEGFDGFFPATRVNYTRIGANLYAPIYKGLGAVVGFNTYVDGRNLGKSTGGSIGIVYNY